jgi:hypothetical protein
MARPVRSVSNTRIFVGRDDTRQLTIYEMAVQLATPGNAMILPAPAATADQVGLIDMSEAADFFDDIDKVFEPLTLGTKSRSIDTNSFLEVHEVGSYLVSIASSLDDLDRVNPAVFTLSPEALATLADYTDGFAFVVAQLRESGNFHPLAYTHPTPPQGHLFIPTRHEHGGKDDRSRAPWDHHIYHQTQGVYVELPGSKDKSEARGNASNYGMVAKLAKHYGSEVPDLTPFLDVDQNSRIVRSRFHGSLRNIDLQLAV